MKQKRTASEPTVSNRLTFTSLVLYKSPLSPISTTLPIYASARVRYCVAVARALVLRLPLRPPPLAARQVQDMELEEAHAAEQAMRKQRREQAKQVVKNGYGNSELRQSYDAVVANMMGLLKAQTLELRDVQVRKTLAMQSCDSRRKRG